jgi:transcription initiation factor TFIID TATA-box-binding protein
MTEDVAVPTITVTESDIVCHNVLALAETNSELDLAKVIVGFKNAEYDPSKFSCVRVRMWKEGCTVAIFSTGKLQVTGASDPESAHLALKKVAYRLKHTLGYSELIFSNFKIDNILATFDIGSSMNLLGLSRDPDLKVTYEPMRFIAAVVRTDDVTVDVFSTGKMNIKGKDSIQNLILKFNSIIIKLIKYICETL